MASATATVPRRSDQLAKWGIAIFLVLAIGGLFYVKWFPLFNKAFVAASKHSIGASIVSGTSNAPPAFSFAAAWDYALAYGADIWTAIVLGLLLGSAVQTLVPRDWLLKVLGTSGAKSSTVAALAAVPSMMCTCCSAPVVVGLHRAKAAPGAVMAYWLGNPVLNPATIVFMGFVLGWNWALFRIVIGILLVAGAAIIGNRFSSHDQVPESATRAALAAVDGSQDDGANPFVAWGRNLWRLVIGLIPEYIVIVMVLGAARAFLFPAMSPALGSSILLMLGLAIAGTLFVIPTAGEVPIIQTLLSYGLGAGGAGALMITLPAVSLPSLVMVGRSVPARLLLRIAILVAVTGVVTGLLALALHI